MRLIKYSKVLIIGSGPSGYMSSIYISRANLNPLVVTGNEIGGQLINTKINNWPGYIEIDGFKLMNFILLQVKSNNIELIYDYIYSINNIKKPNLIFGLIYNYYVDLVIIATGSKHKYLFLKNEKYYIGKNISFCSICDGNFYKNKRIVVVGGGNLAIENVLYLSNIVNKIILIHRNLKFKAEQIIINNIFVKKNLLFRFNCYITNLVGDFYHLKYIKIKNLSNKIFNIIKIDGLFISIGNYPASNIFKGQLIMNNNYIVTYNYCNNTNINGIFVSGDIQDCFYKQAIISCGFGASAALDLVNYYSLLTNIHV